MIYVRKYSVGRTYYYDLPPVVLLCYKICSCSVPLHVTVRVSSGQCVGSFAG